jgi:hypothetical protein
MEEFQLFRGTENSRNSVPSHSTEEKNVWNSVPWNKNRSKLSELLSKPFRGKEPTWNSVPWNKKRSKLSEFRKSRTKTLSIPFAEAGFFVKPILFLSFRSVPGCGIDSSINLGMTTYFDGIMEIILSLFCAIFSERNSVANPTFNQ